MGVLDRLASAEVSSDLQHHEHTCDVDTIGAAGMAAANFAHVALFRLKYLNDLTEIEAAKRLMIQWARIHMVRRKLDPRSASRVGVQALTSWVDDVCKACHGVRYVQFDGAPTLSDRQCPTCNGSGKVYPKQAGVLGEVFKDLRERADSAVVVVQRRLKWKMGG